MMYAPYWEIPGQSAENLKVTFKGPTPILIRNKMNKKLKLKSITSEYNMSKIPTSRTRLKR